ncbi:MAG: tetratricopeptide repeat protein [Sphingobacteriales bacterium]|nr:MAG: tetratricopeptide repeat protein [Sphingobacteriales bacterium]
MAKTVAAMDVQSEPKVLQVHGDSVMITVKGKFPPKSFAKNGIVRFQPVLRYDTVEQPLKTMYIKGEKVKLENAKTINYKNGGSFTYTDKVEYTPQMKKSDLTMEYAVKLDSKYDDLDQCVPVDTDTPAVGTITTSLSVKPTDDILFYDNDEGVGNGKKVIFYYVINEGSLRDSVKKGPTMTQVRTIVKDTTFKYSSIVFRSYASPDGEVARNAELTKLRAKSAETVVRAELKRLGVKQIYDSTFVKRPDTDEDWEGFKRVVSGSNFSGKDEVLGIINSNLSYEEKEANLRKLASWNELKNNILPRLRRTEVVFSGVAGGGNALVGNETEVVVPEDLSKMSQQELIMWGNRTKDTAQRERIYKTYSERFPEDWAGRNNYGAILLQRGRYEEANTIFEALHNEFRNNDTIHNNYGVAQRFLRKYNSAKENYMTAQGNGVKENNNLGILYIKYGDYASSIASFEADRCDYNVVLAYTLNGDYETAKRKFDCIETKKAADYYLRAIIGARSGDKDLMTTSLTRAIEMDASFRDMAKEDLEFKDFKNTSEFTNAIR